LGFKPNGFRPKTIGKKVIIHLKSVYKSSGLGFKLFFKSSLQPKDTGCGPSILVGTRKASDEISSPKILTEEGFGSGSVVGSVLGLPEVGFEMFLKGSPIG
jgi:hypothetical protein